MSQNIRERAWFTAHVRMRTEARLRRLSWFFKFLIFWSSTVLTCLTVYQLTAPKNADRDIISAAIAIFVFALSIFIPSLNLEKQAEKFRECYLRLQRLMDTEVCDKNFSSEYYNVLDVYPNHAKRDYTDFIVISALNKQYISRGGSEVSPTCFMWVSYFSRRICAFLALVAVVVSPSLLYFLL